MRNPLSDTPSAVTKSITDHGGTNEYGRPYWRVILSDNHTKSKRGLWCDWDGTENWEQFSLQGAKLRHNELHPARIVDEVRETPMWPRPNGWILERWFPAEVWGSRESWSKNSAYPEEGDYYLIAPTGNDDKGDKLIWTEIPDLHDLKQAISIWERDYLNRPRDFAVAYTRFVSEEKAAQEEEERKSREEMEYFYRHEVVPIFNSTSLSAQAIRNQCAEAAGVKEHVGAGQ